MTSPATLEQRRTEARRKIDEAMAVMGKHLRPGVVLTHTRCMGCIEEHVYTGVDGIWLCGYPTRDTFAMDGGEGRRKANTVNDIAPSNVTHINRIPVGALDLVVPQYQQPVSGVRS
jgi:hypothetical protein